jgi:hypothetical protein
MTGWTVFLCPLSSSMFHTFMVATVTLMAMPGALYVLIEYPDLRSRIWAMGIVTTLLTYWLRGM